MSLSSYAIALISGGFAIVGGIAGAWAGAAISRKAAIDLFEKKEFNRAAALFSCAFTKEIRLIEDSTIETDFAKMFFASYVRYRNAIITFKPYLSKTERIEIEKAWDKHCYPQGLSGHERTLHSAKFMHYEHRQKVEMRNGEPVIIEEHEVSFEKARDRAMENMEKLLSFAKITT